MYVKVVLLKYCETFNVVPWWVTCEIKLFQNYLTGLLQLKKFFNMFNAAEIISELFQWLK